MRTQLTIILATLSVVAAPWNVDCCCAQDAKPAEKVPAEKGAVEARPAQPALPQVAPQLGRALPAAPNAAGLAVPMRMVPARGLVRRAGDGLPFSLSDLVLAKFDDGAKGPQLVALVEQSRTEQRTVTVTKFIQEIKTRKVSVTDKDGKVSEVDQDYTVAVPVTEEIEQMVQVPAGKKPTTFPFDELRIYRLDGTKLTEADARKELEKMTPVFLLRGFTGDIKAVEGVYLQALNPSCLIVVTENRAE
jgi:hypothetical protein